LNLILDSHPQIKGVDEGDFYEDLLDEYLTDPKYSPCVTFKLPKISHLVPALPKVSGIKILWCLRDPRDVVTSMLKLDWKLYVKAGLKDMILWGMKTPHKTMASLLKLKLEPISISWASYPGGAKSEIERSVKALKHRKLFPEELGSEWERYKKLKQKHPLRFSRKDEVFLGALCWRVKQEILAICPQDENLYVVRYEDLIRNPETEIRTILQFLHIPWHENVLKHHLLHSNTSVGKTESSRPIDAKSIKKWKTFLSEDEVETIKRVCAPVAKDFYTLDSH
jgi:hypothetical protein